MDRYKIKTGVGDYPDDDDKWCEMHGEDIDGANACGDKSAIRFLQKLFDIRFPQPEKYYG